MRDTVTGLISTYDITGRYLDRDAIDSLKSYFDSFSRCIFQSYNWLALYPMIIYVSIHIS
jgi:hypothetical protein